MFSKGCHVIGENALRQELEAERNRHLPIVPERPFYEVCTTAPRVAVPRQPRRSWQFRRLLP